VLLPAAHRAAQAASVPLASLARDEFVLFPRHLARRLHDILVAVFRRAGFEPRLRAESFHAGWDLGLLADIGAGVRVPASVSRGLPEGVVAIKLTTSTTSSRRAWSPAPTGGRPGWPRAPRRRATCSRSCARRFADARAGSARAA
jgi:hypothetical protein